MPIYLDYSATTPPRPEAIAIVQQILQDQWGNPSSLHSWGSRAALALETARLQVAQLLNVANPDCIIFTSGGTESNNLAIFGVTQQYAQPQHLIISSVEHSAVSEPARWLESRGWQVTRLAVDHQGRIDPQALAQAMQDNTVLVSIIYGQSEVGTLQPISELGRIAQERGVLFHTDAVQCAGRVSLDLAELPVDLLSLSSHKLYGIQGSGALYRRQGVSLHPLLGGGGQEQGYRSGTQALPAIAAFGIAAELAQQELSQEAERLTQLREQLFTGLADCPLLQPTGSRRHRLPHHVSFVVVDPGDPGRSLPITGKTLVRALDRRGIAISAGAACQSGKLNPSPILLALGYSPDQALGGIRLTLGRDTTPTDIEATIQALQAALAEVKICKSV
ncbi:cysteine desulfurase family protein [Synechocystis sp. LKSZ1]|uniref:cysteine desulfurase family protein n=1 Tax=Synechocystis sp. LKSZ1 TaxID=3144951 RepID=UPI00336C0C61